MAYTDEQLAAVVLSRAQKRQVFAAAIKLGGSEGVVEISIELVKAMKVIQLEGGQPRGMRGWVLRWLT